MDLEAAFAMYFTSVASFQFHPGAGTREHHQLTLEECAHVANDMLIIHLQYFPRSN